MDELNDWSTSIGRSPDSVVGDGFGDEYRVEGNESAMGEDEKLMMAFWRRG